ncbi:hypothetical protein ACFSQQ_34745 [Mesorhizobium kowhaii]|jgi:hypothetical protein|uniref:hypothetical protein n=1 Tax=Mesorhizobium kowhaii TaxID=1300272 RepID=UPI0035E5BC62
MKSRRSDSPDVGKPSSHFQSRSCSAWTKNLPLEIAPGVSTLNVFLIYIKELYETAGQITNCVGGPVFTRPARTVNRNEPFGSILDAANSHFSKPLTFFGPWQGVELEEIAAGYGCRRDRISARQSPTWAFRTRVAPHGYDVVFMPMTRPRS